MSKDQITRINSRAVPYDTVTPRRALREADRVGETQRAADSTGSLGGMRVRRWAVRVTTTNPSAYCVNGIPLDDPRSNGTDFRSDIGYRAGDLGGAVQCQHQSSLSNGPWAQELDTVDPSALRGPDKLLYQRLPNGTCPVWGTTLESVRVGDRSWYSQPYGSGCKYSEGAAPYPQMNRTEFRQLVTEVYNLRTNNFTKPSSPPSTPTPSSASQASSTQNLSSRPSPSTSLPLTSSFQSSISPTSTLSSAPQTSSDATHTSTASSSTASPTLANASTIAGSVGLLATLGSFITPTPTAAIAAAAPALTVSTPALVIGGVVGLGALGGAGVVGYLAVRKYSAVKENIPRPLEMELDVSGESLSTSG